MEVTEVMKQIRVNICNLQEVNGYKHLVFCIDYFSKWSEVKRLKISLLNLCCFSCMKSSKDMAA